MCGCKLLKVCRNLGNSCEHRHYDSADTVFLICHVTSREHMFKWLCEFMDGSSSWRVPSFPYLVAICLE